MGVLSRTGPIYFQPNSNEKFGEEYDRIFKKKKTTKKSKAKEEKKNERRK
jgi:hypothetical protein